MQILRKKNERKMEENDGGENNLIYNVLIISGL